MPATVENAKKAGPSAAKKTTTQAPASADPVTLTPQEVEQEFASQVSEIGTAAEEAYKVVSSKVQEFLQTFRDSLHQKHERDEQILSDHRAHTVSQQTQIEWLQSVIKERDNVIMKMGDERIQTKKDAEVQSSLLREAKDGLKEKDRKIEELQRELTRLEGVDNKLKAETELRREKETALLAKDGKIILQLGRIMSLEREQQGLNTTLQSTRASVESLTKQLDERQKLLEERDNRLSMCEAQLEEQGKKCRNTEEQLVASESQVKKLRDENATLTARFKRDLDTFLSESTSKVDSLTSRINQYEQGEKGFLRVQTENKEAIQGLKDENFSLHKRLVEATEQLKQRQSNIEDLQKECQDLQSKLKDLQEKYESNNKTSEIVLAQLRGELKMTQSDLVSHREVVAVLRKQIEATESELDEINLKLDAELLRSTRQSKLAEAAEGKAKKLTSELQSLKEQQKKALAESKQSEQRAQLRSSASLFAVKKRKTAVEESLKEVQQKVEQGMERKKEEDKKMKEVSDQLDAARTKLSEKEAELKAALGRIDELKTSYKLSSKEADDLRSLLQPPEPRDPITGPLLIPYAITRLETGPISVQIGDVDSEIQRQFDQYKVMSTLEIQSLREQMERKDHPPMDHDQTSLRLKALEERCSRVEKQLKDAVEENIELRGKIDSCEEVEQALRATRDILKGVEGRLRDAVVENSDLRRKVHKW